MQHPGVYGQHCTDPGHFMALNMFGLARETRGDVCERLDRHEAAGQTGSFHETVFEEMTVDGNIALAAVMFPAAGWREIDTPADLDAAGLVFPWMRTASRCSQSDGRTTFKCPTRFWRRSGSPVYVVADADALRAEEKHPSDAARHADARASHLR